MEDGQVMHEAGCSDLTEFKLFPKASALLRLSGAAAVTHNGASMPPEHLASNHQYMNFVYMHGGFNVSYRLAQLPGTFTGRVVNLKGYYNRYSKAPGSETLVSEV